MNSYNAKHKIELFLYGNGSLSDDLAEALETAIKILNEENTILTHKAVLMRQKLAIYVDFRDRMGADEKEVMGLADVLKIVDRFIEEECGESPQLFLNDEAEDRLKELKEAAEIPAVPLDRIKEAREDIAKGWYIRPANRYEEGKKDRSLECVHILDNLIAESEG